MEDRSRTKPLGQAAIFTFFPYNRNTKTHKTQNTKPKPRPPPQRHCWHAPVKARRPDHPHYGEMQMRASWGLCACTWRFQKEICLSGRVLTPPLGRSLRRVVTRGHYSPHAIFVMIRVGTYGQLHAASYLCTTTLAMAGWSGVGII